MDSLLNSWVRGWFLPLLDLVEVGQKGDGDEDNDGLLAVADLNLNGKMSDRVRFKSRAHKTEILLERRVALRIFFIPCPEYPSLVLFLHVDMVLGVGCCNWNQSTNPTILPRSIEIPQKFASHSRRIQFVCRKLRAVILTSRAETNCRGRRVAFRSCVLLSRSKRAPAIAVSSSEGFCRDGELGAILLMAAIIASDGVLREVLVVMSTEEVRRLNGGWEFAVGSALSLRVRYFPTRLSVAVLGLYCDWLAVRDYGPTIALAGLSLYANVYNRCMIWF